MDVNLTAGSWPDSVDGALLEAVICGLPALTVYAVEWDETPQPTRADLLELLDRAEVEQRYTAESAPDLHLLAPAIAALRAELTAPAVLPAAA